MPFEKPWRNYQPEDLLYGLYEPRERLAKQFNLPDDGVWTIDDFDTFFANRYHSWLVHEQSFVDTLANHDKYRASLNYDLKNKVNWNKELLNAAAIAKRKCKAGLL